MGRQIEVNVVVEQRLDPPSFRPPASLALKVENIVFESRGQGGPVLGDDLGLQSFLYKVSVVVDTDVRSAFLPFEPVKVDSVLVVLAHVVADRHIRIRPLHDATKPEVVVAVVVLDLDTDGIEIKNAVSCIVATAVGSRLFRIQGIGLLPAVGWSNLLQL